jgi:hypothetical protein
MSHAFVGVLTCARIHSIRLDREFLPLLLPFSLRCSFAYALSGRGGRDDHVRRYTLAHPPCGIPRFELDRRSAYHVRVRHQREQGRQYRPRRLFRFYALVG